MEFISLLIISGAYVSKQVFWNRARGFTVVKVTYLVLAYIFWNVENDIDV